MWMVIKRKLNNAYKYICKNSLQFTLSYLTISDLLALYIFINAEKMITDIDLAETKFRILKPKESVYNCLDIIGV